MTTYRAASDEIFLKIRSSSFYLSVHLYKHVIEVWGVLSQKQVSRAGKSNYIPHELWDVITCPWPWYLLLAQQSQYLLWIFWKKIDHNVKGLQHTNALVQERCNSIANALELHLSCTNPSIQWWEGYIPSGSSFQPHLIAGCCDLTHYLIYVASDQKLMFHSHATVVARLWALTHYNLLADHHKTGYMDFWEGGKGK